MHPTSKEHENCVLEVANVLAGVGKVHVDLPSDRAQEHASVLTLNPVTRSFRTASNTPIHYQPEQHETDAPER